MANFIKGRVDNVNASREAVWQLSERALAHGFPVEITDANRGGDPNLIINGVPVFVRVSKVQGTMTCPRFTWNCHVRMRMPAGLTDNSIWACYGDLGGGTGSWWFVPEWDRRAKLGKYVISTVVTPKLSRRDKSIAHFRENWDLFMQEHGWFHAYDREPAPLHMNCVACATSGPGRVGALSRPPATSPPPPATVSTEPVVTVVDDDVVVTYDE